MRNKQLNIINLLRISTLLSRVSFRFIGMKLTLITKYDQKAYENGRSAFRTEPRVYIQIVYWAPNHGKGVKKMWKGRKWYLSEYMTDDEIIKTAYLAFRTCIEHEILESFLVDGKLLFNPHVSFEELLKISHKEVARKVEKRNKQKLNYNI